MTNKNAIKGLYFAAAGGIGWGISGVCSQYLFSMYHIDAVWITATRMILSGLVLLAISFCSEKTRIFHIFRNKTDCKWLILFAVFGLLLCQYTFMGAIKFSNSATATVLQSLNVIIMAVLISIHSHTKMHLLQVLSIFLAVIGTYLIATKGSLSEMSLSFLGLMLGILAAVGVVSYTLLSRPILKKWSNTTVTGWGMLIGGTILGLIMQVWIVPSSLDLRAILIIAIIVLIGTAGSFSAFLQGVKYIGPVKATLIGCLEPATATVFAAIFLKTQFTFIEIIGFICIIVTVFLSAFEKKETS